MDLGSLTPVKGSVRKTKRVGRGNASGWGRTAGRGMNGYKARSGSKTKPHFEGGQTPMARRLPKRGMGKGKFNHLSSHKKDVQILNITDLVKLNIKDIDKNILKENGLINYTKLPVKILGNGNIETSINVNVDFFSDSAKGKIEKAGGKAQTI